MIKKFCDGIIKVDLENGPKPREVYVETRPWGQFTRFPTEGPSTTKEIKVNPGESLSLQSHEMRDERWFFNDSNLEVQIIFPEGREKRTKSFPGLVLFIKKGWKHRLMNKSDKIGFVIEISEGVFDENDIVRFEDDYGRIKEARVVSHEIKIEEKWLELD